MFSALELFASSAWGRLRMVEAPRGHRPVYVAHVATGEKTQDAWLVCLL
jgi:hypothetical protein